MSDKGSNDIYTTTRSNIRGHSQDFDCKLRSRVWNKPSASKKIAKAHSYSGPSDLLAPGLTSTLPRYLTHSYHEPIKKEGILQKKKHSRSDNGLRVNTAFCGGGLRTVTGEVGCESEVSSVLMKSGGVFLDRSARSFTSYVQQQQSGRSMLIFGDKDELPQVRRAGHTGPSVGVAASSVNELEQESFGRNIDIQESFSNRCCFVGHSIESCPCEENSLAKQRRLGVVFQGFRGRKGDRINQRCMPSGMGLAFGKRLSRSCFKNFSCISSADVLPSIRNCLTCVPSRHRTKKHNTGGADVCRQGSTRECAAAEGVFSADLGVAPRMKRLSFMRRASIKPDILISESSLSNEPSVYEHNDINENLQDLHESSSNTSEDLSILPSTSLCGESHTSQCDDMEEGRGEAEYEMSSFPALTGHSGPIRSTLNLTRPPTSPFRASRHRRNLEIISSPLYMSSPEVLFGGSDLPGSYSSSSLRSATLLENYGHHTCTVETPVFRPLRQLPFRGFELNPLCLSFGGYSESSSNWERADTEDLSYELFMWEANMFLNGIAYHDQYRDMRLDVDNMTYEELLSLEESIGTVSTGLDKGEISRRLKCTRYLPADKAPLSSRGDIEVKCSICQEEFVERVELGGLECGHNYHIPCIEQWLLQKNQCPICKASTS